LYATCHKIAQKLVGDLILSTYRDSSKYWTLEFTLQKFRSRSCC